jgi:hypothetical protein
MSETADIVTFFLAISSLLVLGALSGGEYPKVLPRHEFNAQERSVSLGSFQRLAPRGTGILAVEACSEEN